MKISEVNKRAEEFLSCLGNGKNIYQIESENDFIDEKLKTLCSVRVAHRTHAPKVLFKSGMSDEELEEWREKKERKKIALKFRRR